MSSEVPSVATTDLAEADLHDRVGRRRGRLVTAVVLVVLLVGLGAVWGLGGFERRQDRFTEVAPGTTLTSGPYELTLNGATVQHKTDDNTWEVVVAGYARTTGDISLQPQTGKSGFVFGQGSRSREVANVHQFVLTTVDNALIDPDVLTPGLAPVPLDAHLTFTQDPGDVIRVAVFDQEYRTAYVFGDELAWRATQHANELYLTPTVLPESEY